MPFPTTQNGSNYLGIQKLTRKISALREITQLIRRKTPHRSRHGSHQSSTNCNSYECKQVPNSLLSSKSCINPHTPKEDIRETWRGRWMMERDSHTFLQILIKKRNHYSACPTPTFTAA